MLIVLCGGSLVRPAAAGPSVALEEAGDDAQVVAQARELFRHAIELGHQGRWPEALSLFQRSNELRPHVFTTYNIGFCERALAQYARAYRTFTRTIEQSRASDVTPSGEALVAAAERYLNEIRPRLATALVTVGALDTELFVDGQPLERVGESAGRPLFFTGARDLGSFAPSPNTAIEIKLDPGAHLFHLAHAAPPLPDVNRTFAEGESAVITLGRAQVRAPVAGTNLPANLPARTPARGAEATPGETAPSSRLPAYLFLGAGAALAATGSFFGLMAVEKRSELYQACPYLHCQPDQAGDLASLRRYSDAATLGIATGVVGLAAGTWIIFRSGKAPAPARTSARTTRLWVGRSLIGIERNF